MTLKERLKQIEREMDAIQVSVRLVLTADGVEIHAKNEADRLLAKAEVRRTGAPIVTDV